MRLAALKIHQGIGPLLGTTVQLSPLARSRKGKAASAGRVRRSAAPISRTQSSAAVRSEEHTSELQSLMRISYAVFCLKKKTNTYLASRLLTTRNNQHRPRQKTHL